ncbi:hypothetical protein KC337_g101 [Hortaea werneckii]|nr:hypothetical protein KC337_g101 [Hortaea werneckii]
MPSFVAASKSTLSTPTPALATTRRLLPAVKRSAVTLVSERTMRASKSPIIDLSSSALMPLRSCTSSDSCRSRKPSGDTFSGLSNFVFCLRNPVGCCDRYDEGTAKDQGTLVTP